MLKKHLIQVSFFLSAIICATTAIATENSKNSNQDINAADLESPGTQTICPVMGGKADKNLYVDIKGKRIYMCCLACEDGIKTEPDRYIKKIHKKNQTPAVLRK